MINGRPLIPVCSCYTKAVILRAIPLEKVVGGGVSDAPKKKCRGVVWELFLYYCGVVCKNVRNHCGVVSQLDHSTIAGWSKFWWFSPQYIGKRPHMPSLICTCLALFSFHFGETVSHFGTLPAEVNEVEWCHRAGTDFRTHWKRAKGLWSGPKKGSDKLEKGLYFGENKRVPSLNDIMLVQKVNGKLQKVSYVCANAIPENAYLYSNNRQRWNCMSTDWKCGVWKKIGGERRKIHKIAIINKDFHEKIMVNVNGMERPSMESNGKLPTRWR